MLNHKIKMQDRNWEQKKKMKIKHHNFLLLSSLSIFAYFIFVPVFLYIFFPGEVKLPVTFIFIFYFILNVFFTSPLLVFFILERKKNICSTTYYSVCTILWQGQWKIYKGSDKKIWVWDKQKINVLYKNANDYVAV